GLPEGKSDAARGVDRKGPVEAPLAKLPDQREAPEEAAVAAAAVVYQHLGHVAVELQHFLLRPVDQSGDMRRRKAGAPRGDQRRGAPHVAEPLGLDDEDPTQGKRAVAHSGARLVLRDWGPQQIHVRSARLFSRVAAYPEWPPAPCRARARPGRTPP